MEYTQNMAMRSLKKWNFVKSYWVVTAIILQVVVFTAFIFDVKTVNLMKWSSALYGCSGLLCDKNLHDHWIIFEDNDINENELRLIEGKTAAWTLLVICEIEKKIVSDRVIFFGNKTRNKFSLFNNNQSFLQFSNPLHLLYNQAYVFAIASDAKHILETTKGALLNDEINFKELAKSVADYSLRPKVDEFFNYDEHSGKPSTFTSSKHVYEIVPKPSLDVVEIARKQNRLTGKGVVTGIPNVALPSGVVSVSSSPSSYLFSHNAFWGMVFLPSFGKESKVLRSIILQKLLAVTKGSYGYQAVLTSDKLYDTPVDQTYVKTLLLSVRDWHCKSGVIQECLMELLIHLSGTGHVTNADVKYASTWLSDLRRFSYYFNENPPKIVTKKNNNTNIIYYPPVVEENNEMFDRKSRDATFGKISEFCPNSSNNQYEKTMSHDIFDDILLLISYNFKHTENMKILDLFYKYKFPHVLYCSPGEIPVGQTSDLRASFVSSKPYGGQNVKDIGSIVTDCMVNAIRVNYNVNGMLHISDDVAIFPWNLKNLNRSRVWFSGDSFRQSNIGDLLSKKSLNSSLIPVRNMPDWISKYHYRGLKDSFDEMSRAPESSAIKKCYNSLKFNLKGPYRFYFGQADIFYIPGRLMQDFARILDVFDRNGVFFEISVPTVLECVIDEPRVYIKWKHFDIGTRQNMMEKYSKFSKDPYVHPYKFGLFLQNNELTKSFFCNKIVDLYFRK